MSGDEHDDDFDDIPLHHKKPFGSGLRRNEIKFVPAGAVEGSLSSSSANTQGQSVRDFYLGMVLKKKSQDDDHDKQETIVELCEVCHMPIQTAEPPLPPPPQEDNTTGRDEAAKVEGTRTRRNHHHEASIAHQVCLNHSHPPSALDRTRMGLSVLAAQGWDPDARTGLGAAGQGVNHPIKVKPKDDHLGIGVQQNKKNNKNKNGRDSKEKPAATNKLLDAKRVRKMAAEDRKKTDRLQQQIFGKIDLDKYLGSGG